MHPRSRIEEAYFCVDTQPPHGGNERVVLVRPVSVRSNLHVIVCIADVPWPAAPARGRGWVYHPEIGLSGRSIVRMPDKNMDMDIVRMEM